MIWPPPNTTLEGDIVSLAPIREELFGPVLAASGAEESWTWIDRRVPGDEEEFRAWFDARVRASKEGAEWCFVTVAKGTGDAIGSSSYLAPRPEDGGVEIGWSWLHPSAWRTGANREAKLLMLAFAFEELGAMRVEFKTDARNERSLEALAGIGAGFEGIFRKHMLMPVVGVRDSAYFSIVDDDWPEVASGLRASLRKRQEVGS